MAAELEETLREVARIGPYFDLVPPEDGPVWRPVSDIYHAADPVALDGLISLVHRRLGAGERRVAASILVQGYAAHLWSPVLATVAACGRIPDLSSLWWRYVDGEPLNLRVREYRSWAATDVVTGTLQVVSTVHLGPLITAVRSTVRLSERLLWGNVASALAGALPVIKQHRPDLSTDAATLAIALLDRPPLRSAGTLVERVHNGQTALSYRRRTCCLYYRIPGGGLCGDCVFA